MRLAILTSGGDAPGMNAAVWRLAREATARGWQAIGVRDGFLGLLERRAEPIDPFTAARFARLGGTWLGTARLADLPSHLDALVSSAEALELDAFAVLGGNGSLAGAARLAERTGRPVVGIAASIDNDVGATDYALGFDTAVGVALEAADRLRDTAESLPRFVALETLGGPTGHIAQAVGTLAGAVATLVPESAVDVDDTAAKVADALAHKTHPLVVASEGVPDLRMVLDEVATRAESRLRFVSLGHSQRGGTPGPRDRAAAAAYAHTAAVALEAGRSGIVALQAGTLSLVPFCEAHEAGPPNPDGWRGLL